MLLRCLGVVGLGASWGVVGMGAWGVDWVLKLMLVELGANSWLGSAVVPKIDRRHIPKQQLAASSFPTPLQRPVPPAPLPHLTASP